MRRLGGVGTWTLVIAIGLLAGLPTQADVRKGNGEFGFDFGVTEFDSSFAGGGQSGARFDLRAGYMISNLFEIEGLIGYSGVDNGELATAFVNGVFNFATGPRLIPYFLVGAGAARLEYNSADDTGVAGQFAGGFRGFGSKGKIGLRLEIGAMVMELFDETTTQVNLTFGFTFALGHRHIHRPPRPRKSFGE